MTGVAIENVVGRRKEGGGTEPLEDWGINSEYGALRDVLLGPVESFTWSDNSLFSSIARAADRKAVHFDKQAAVRQYREVVDAYESAGVTVYNPLQVFARDSSFMTPFGAVICQLANPRRRGEYASALRFYVSKGIPLYDMVSAGTFEGGDFNLICPGSVLIGYTGFRCEEVAARQIGGWMEKEGWEVKYAPIDPFYVHIDLMVVMLADKLAAVCLDTTDPEIVAWLEGKGIEIVPVDFRTTIELGCNVVALGRDRVLASARSADLNARLRAQGFEVYDPDISMITRMGGGLHCMAQPLRRDRV
jgi:N-dimethylarginine dimethylaminohydrolase